ncbi:Hypothetical predicted protein [Octopus vulgaris]|uniref:Uncharacterized protein n=1 Tax=Octopus vulgaris TaxID=6645 RepID=A0AA36FJ67_OCTVU|nr:Hypothetical predicted protein [Octopus vulgaris]
MVHYLSSDSTDAYLSNEKSQARIRHRIMSVFLTKQPRLYFKLRRTGLELGISFVRMNERKAIDERGLWEPLGISFMAMTEIPLTDINNEKVWMRNITIDSTFAPYETHSRISSTGLDRNSKDNIPKFDMYREYCQSSTKAA